MHIVNDGLWFGLVLFFLLCFDFLFLACAHLSGCMYRCQGKKTLRDRNNIRNNIREMTHKANSFKHDWAIVGEVAGSYRKVA